MTGDTSMLRLANELLEQIPWDGHDTKAQVAKRLFPFLRLEREHEALTAERDEWKERARSAEQKLAGGPYR